MRLNIKDLELGTKNPAPLPFNKILIKSSDYDGLGNGKGKFMLPKNLLWQMVATCMHDDGIGLAAPQIGFFKRLFIMRDFDEISGMEESFSPYFNPTWTAIREEGKSESPEGCLSVPGKSYMVERWNAIDAKWWDFDEVTGEPLERSERLTGYRARVFQHEFQHLNAISIVNVGKPI